MNRFARITLLAYPRAFRRGFGRDYLRSVTDLRTHSSRSNTRIALSLLIDAATVAPTMRWENLMNSSKTALIVVVAVVATFGIVIGAPLVALPLLAVMAVLVVAARRHDHPIADEAARWASRWYLWLAAAGVPFLIGSAMLFTAHDGELSTAAWAAWMLGWLAAAIIATIGVGLGVTRFIAQRRSRPVATSR